MMRYLFKDCLNIVMIFVIMTHNSANNICALAFQKCKLLFLVNKNNRIQLRLGLGQDWILGRFIIYVHGCDV